MQQRESRRSPVKTKNGLQPSLHKKQKSVNVPRQGVQRQKPRQGFPLKQHKRTTSRRLSAHEQALLAHAEALNAIAQREAADTETVTAERAQILATAFDDITTAASAFAADIETAARMFTETLTALDTATQTQVSGLAQQITDAETQAGVSFAEAQANYVPALSAHEQALQTHAAALAAIDVDRGAGIQTAIAEEAAVLKGSFVAAAVAGTTLAETLMAINAAEQNRRSTLDTETAGTIAGLNQQITDAETRTGISFEEALTNYTPAVDLNTQALQALTAALNAAETERTENLGAVDAAGALDRHTTQTAQQALETGASVSIEEARANFVPALSSAAQATLTLNTTMRDLESSFRAAIAEIGDAGRVDRQATDAAIQEAVANAISQQTALETQAGTTFADASAAFQPGISDIAQAGVDRDTAIREIDQSETAGIDAVNAQSPSLTDSVRDRRSDHGGT